MIINVNTDRVYELLDTCEYMYVPIMVPTISATPPRKIKSES